MNLRWIGLCLLVLSATWVCLDADEYRDRRTQIQKRDPRHRRVPEIPAKDRKLRVIFDTDVNNEIDDVWALALALCCPERFQIEGIVATHYDNSNQGAGPESIETSVRVAAEVLEQAGMKGRIPIKRGSPPLRYQYEPSESEGVDFLIKTAMTATAKEPLWIVSLGAATNVASAYLKEPSIAERVIVFWHGRTQWPRRCWNFNVFGDVRAARLLFHSDLPLVLFDTGTHLTCPMAESKQWEKISPLGRYLHAFRMRSSGYQKPTKGFFDLGDVAALVEPKLASWEVVDCPEVDWDLAYQFRKTKGKILRCHQIDRDGTFALLADRLKAATARKAFEGKK